MWDLGGSERIRPYWTSYLGGMSAIIYVVDSNDELQFESSWNVLNKFLEKVPDDLPLLVFANKQDEIEAHRVSAICEALRLNQLRGRPWYIQATSARTAAGILEGLDWLDTTLHKD